MKMNWTWFGNEGVWDINIFRFLSLASQAKVTWLYVLCWARQLRPSSQGLWLQWTVLGCPVMWDTVRQMCVGLSSHVRCGAVEMCWDVQSCEMLGSLSFAFFVPKFCPFHVLQDLLRSNEHSGAHKGLQVLGWSPDLMQRESTAEAQGPCPPPTLCNPPSGGWSSEKTCVALLPANT